MKVHSRRYLLAGVVLLLAALAYALYMYFNPTRQISALKTDEKISAAEMLREFENDASAADSRFSGKILEVSGQVHKVSNEGAAPVVVFDEGGKFVITAGMEEANVNLEAGKDVSLKGLYSGIIVNDMLPVNDIKIEQCSIVE